MTALTIFLAGFLASCIVLFLAGIVYIIRRGRTA